MNATTLWSKEALIADNLELKGRIAGLEEALNHTIKHATALDDAVEERDEKIRLAHAESIADSERIRELLAILTLLGQSNEQ